jgi:acetoin utilization protein AcuB
MNYRALDTMTCDLIKTKIDESLESAFLKMKKHGIRHLPVADEFNRIVGIISDRDVLRGMQPDLRDYQSFQVENADFDPHARVRDFMSWPVKTVSHDTDLRVVITKMIREKVSAFLVTHDSAIVGIVTSEDLLKLLYELLGDKYLNELSVEENQKTWIGNLMRAAR